MISGDAVNATVGLAGPGLRGVHNDDLVGAAARSLAARAANPSQTPGLRRTGTLAPLPEPKRKKSVWGTILAALLLLGVIAYCAKKLLPVYYDVRQHQGTPALNDPATPTGTQAPENAQSASADAATQPAEGENSGAASPQDGPASNSVPGADVDSKPPRVVKAPLKKAEPILTPKAAEYKGRIEQVISERGLASRAKVQGAGSTLTLAGKLRPAEHGALLKFLRDAPSDVRIIDHIEYDDAPEATGANPSAATGSGGHPVPGRGYGAIHVVTDVIGATAMLHGPSGAVLSQCQTPCSFNNLVPDRYSLEVKKDGYEPVQTALQVKQGKVADQKLSMESIAKGLFITSDPPGADVFINGAKQSGQTPVTLPLAAGQYNLVLRLPGYDPYVGSVQVKDNIQTQLSTKLAERSASRVAFADVHSNPAGAEIFVDGTSTGKFTPSRIQLPTGIHNIIIRLNGFQPAKRTVQTTEGGTSLIDESLRPK
jgi:PEGA domain-containing protein